MQITSTRRKVEAARKVLHDIAQPPGTFLGIGSNEYDMAENNGTFTLKMTPTYQRQLQAQFVKQSIEVVRRRIDALGTREPTIQQQGDDRILVQVPGLKNPEELKRVLSTTAKMTFRLVDMTAKRPGRPRRAECRRKTSCFGKPTRLARTRCPI